MDEPQQRKRRISNGTAAAMVLVALVLDAISLIPVAGTIVSTVLGFGIFGLWFYFKDVPLISPKKIASWGINAVAEAFPGVGSVWVGVTVGVILMIAITRTEDRTGVSVIDKIGPKGVSAVKNAERGVAGKVLDARDRINRRLARQEEARPTTPPAKERQPLRDIDFPKAA